MWTDEQKSQALFLGGCMPARAALAYGAAISNENYTLRIALAMICATIALGMLVIFVGGLRKTGGETFGKPIWWNSLRPVHSLAFATAATLLFLGNGKTAAGVLALDQAVGLGAFAQHHTAATTVVAA